MSHDEMIEVIQAHKDGKKIEFNRRAGGLGWESDDNPCWDFDRFDYRIKSEPREWVLEVHSSSGDVVCAWEYPLIENAEPNHGCKFVRVREVLG